MIQSAAMSSVVRVFSIVFSLTLATSGALAQQPVIPGAAGFGINTPAGRGGDVLRVTNLADSGPGSLRHCVEETGPRVCIFEVSGVIRLTSNLTIRNPNLTIAGQTAPEPGIMLRGGALDIRASDVLVQHIAVRLGEEVDLTTANTADSLKINGYSAPVRNVVVDHCSFSWSIDEVAEIAFEYDNITLSNNIFSEPLHDSVHPKGAHGYGMLITAAKGRVSLVGNLFAHAYDRNPRTGAAGFVFVNNVVYHASSRGSALFNEGGVASGNSIVGNVFRRTADAPIILGAPDHPTEVGTKLYLADNMADKTPSDQWSLVRLETDLDRGSLETRSAPSWPSGLVALRTSGDVVLDQVLANAGSRPVSRDAVDSRIVSEVRNRTGNVINCVGPDGTARCEKNGGGWPRYAERRQEHVLPENPNGDDDRDGYTNLEEWLHGLAAQLEDGATINSKRPNPPTITQAN